MFRAAARQRGLQLKERLAFDVLCALYAMAWLLLLVAAFASEQTFRISERNAFYVAPLFFVALMVWKP